MNSLLKPSNLESRSATYKDLLMVHSRLGYDVQILVEDGDLKNVVILPDDTTQFTYLFVEELNCLDDELKTIFISYFRYIIERYQARTVKAKYDGVKRFLLALALSPENQYLVLRRVGTDVENRYVEQAISAVKQFVQFLILFGYDKIPFSEYEAFLELKGYSSSKNVYNSLYMMDPELGPFTKSEIQVLSKQVDNTDHPLKVRLILDLLMCFGLRPIQLSLLKRKDFVIDPTTGLSYLNIPRVKNSTRHRRQEFSSRILSPRTAKLLADFIASQTSAPAGIRYNDLPIFLSFTKIKVDRRSVRGIHYWKDERRKPSDYYLGSNKIAYAHHRSTNAFEYALRSIASKFPLSPRTGEVFSLNPYRFRYTVGTQAVMSGLTPEEVAELLDHSSVHSVDHYFKFTHEMWEILESAVESRIEQKHFAVAWLSDREIEGNVHTKSVCETRSFTSIGKCASKEVCLDEPAIACYACNKFCPSKDVASHRNAMKNLVARRAELHGTSSDNVVAAIDYSISGCNAAIVFAEVGSTNDEND